MAYMVVEIYIAGDSIADFNGACELDGKAYESVQGCVNYLQAMLAGCKDGTVKVVTKDQATTINTSGSGSTSNTFTL